MCPGPSNPSRNTFPSLRTSMRKKDHPLSADEENLMASLLHEKSRSYEARPEFRDELYGRLMREFVLRTEHESSSHRPSPFSLFLRFGAIALAVLILVTGSGLTTAYAYISPAVTRVNNLYFLKRTVERLQLFASPDPEQRSRFYVKLADRRLEEAIFLTEQGDIDLVTLEEIVTNVEEAHALARMVSDPRSKAALNEYIAREAERQRSDLALLVDQVEGEYLQSLADPLVSSEEPLDLTGGASPSAVPSGQQNADTITVLEKAIGGIGTVEMHAIDSPQIAAPSSVDQALVPPDLLVILQSAMEVQHGNVLTLSVRVSNIGGESAPEGFLALSWGDGNQDFLNVSALPHQQEKLLTFTHLYKRAGTYVARAEVSVIGGKERTTANNRATITISVLPPPDACPESGERRCEGQQFMECNYLPEASARSWMTVATCSPDEVCTPAGCKAACSSNCSEANRKECGAGGVVQCARMEDGCLRWKPIQDCSSNQYCGNGACISRPYCGDGRVTIGEDCDDGNTSSGDGCSVACRKESPKNVCGDGKIADSEECDDGNAVPNNGCTACKSDFCEDSDATSQYPGGMGNFAVKGTIKGTGNGGGIYSESDACLDATKLMEFGCIGTKTNVTNYTCPGSCENGACKPPVVAVCGNGTLETGEQCDDGNFADGDGCTGQCLIPKYALSNFQFSCNRHSIYFVYSRSDENVLPAIVDATTNRIVLLKSNVLSPLSANIWAPSIGFDMSLLQHGSTVKLCSKNLSVCSPVTTVTSRGGNGIVEASEECDDGNAINDDQCTNLCKATNPTVNCAETDAGYDLFTKGTVRLKNGQSSTDGCLDAQKLREYQCLEPSHNDYSSFQVECAKGCFEGACLP